MLDPRINRMGMLAAFAVSARRLTVSRGSVAAGSVDGMRRLHTATGTLAGLSAGSIVVVAPGEVSTWSGPGEVTTWSRPGEVSTWSRPREVSVTVRDAFTSVCSGGLGGTRSVLHR
ncbi:MAG: hypothetical protein JOZ64_03010 [Solirubrobacterales bacterium]|nr:hypothetical protein [Solirubrobacterales bacterium]